MNTKCFSFYSYKGGSGRSTTAVNTVFHLIDVMEASPEHPILIVDTDLESAGLTYFFDCKDKFTECFVDSIHTGKFFDENSRFYESKNEQRKFFDQEMRCYACSQTDLVELWNDVMHIKAELVLNGVQLKRSQIRMLSAILRAERVKEEPNEKEQRIRKAWGDSRLNIMIENVRSCRDPFEKAQIIEKYLPTAHFIDVSPFFAKEPGTVRFLGVDVNYLGKRLQYITNSQQITHAGNDLAEDLVEMCDTYGYKAVVFDCGSGIQTTAEMVHNISDVIVYCMRPTIQFIRGTETQLEDYYSRFNRKKSEYLSGYKPVIILPTSIPPVSNSSVSGVETLRKDSFSAISRIVRTYREVVDGSFCTPETALNEVEYFKWREQILGGRVIESSVSPEVFRIAQRYSSKNSMPQDAQRAFRTYRKLAELLVKNANLCLDDDGEE